MLWQFCQNEENFFAEIECYILKSTKGSIPWLPTTVQSIAYIPPYIHHKTNFNLMKKQWSNMLTVESMLEVLFASKLKMVKN